MKRFLLALALLSPSLAAQTPSMTMFPATAPGIPAKTFKTFSVHVAGVNDKTVTWSVSGGASLVGNTVCTEAMTEDCTIAVYDATPGTYTVTATSNANHTTTATATLTLIADPTPLTSHPRLYLNSSNLAAFQTYMASGAAIPTELIALANSLASSDDAAWAAGGGYNGGNSSAGCPGGGGGTGMPSTAYNTLNFGWGVSPEENAIVYALMSLGDPTTGNRTAWACRAHDLYIYNMKDINNHIPGEDPVNCDCLGSPHLLLGNRGSVWSVGVGEVLDWVYSSFTTSDWTNEILPALTSMSTNANTNGGIIATSTPIPLGVQNNPSLFQATASADSYGYIRSFANNYGDYYTTFLISIGIAVDAAQDTPSAHCAGGALVTCTDGTPNSLRADFNYGMGAWMYVQNANFEDPAVVAGEYNQVFGSTLTPNDQCTSNISANPTPISATMPCYGNARGGLSHEGSLYGGWLFHFAKVAAMLTTSGYNDPSTYPQMSFFYSSWWDEHDQGMLHMTTPAIYAPSQSYQLLFNYGPVNVAYDQLNFIIDSQMAQYAMDKYMGRTDRSNELGWLIGNLNLEYSLHTNMFGNLPGAVSMALTQIPGATPFSTFTDPRPTMPSSYYSYNSGQLFTSSGSWSPTTGGVFRRYCPRFPQPNHEEGFCGDFDFYLNGDWVTAGVQSYAFNDNSGYWTGETPESGNMAAYGNTPSVLPNPTSQNEYIVDTLANRGGQFNNGYPTGQNSNAYYSDSSTYTFDGISSIGSRNLYGPNPGIGALSMQDVTGATTDYLWLKPHFLLTYDRGDVSAASFMRRWYTLPNTATLSGTTVSWTSALSKTSDYLHVLKQANANIGVYPIWPYAPNVASNYYPYDTGNIVDIDSGAINHVTTEAHSATNCSLAGVNAVCPTNRVNVIANLGVTGGVSCGSLTQVSTLSVPTSCQYNVTSDYRYTFTAPDLAAGVTLHYDWSTPASSLRTFNVLEAQNLGTGATTTTLVQSSAGQNFDCALIGTNQACFMRTLAAFTGTTYAASGATTQYITDLTPNTLYTISGAGAPGSATTDSAGVLTFAATGTGNLTVGATIPPAITAVTGAILSGGVIW